MNATATPALPPLAPDIAAMLNGRPTPAERTAMRFGFDLCRALESLGKPTSEHERPRTGYESAVLSIESQQIDKLVEDMTSDNPSDEARDILTDALERVLTIPDRALRERAQAMSLRHFFETTAIRHIQRRSDRGAFDEKARELLTERY